MRRAETPRAHGCLHERRFASGHTSLISSLTVSSPSYTSLPSARFPWFSRREPTRRGGEKGTRREPGQGGDRREPTSLIHRKQTTVDRSIINIRAKEQNRKDI